MPMYPKPIRKKKRDKKRREEEEEKDTLENIKVRPRKSFLRKKKGGGEGEEEN